MECHESIQKKQLKFIQLFHLAWLLVPASPTTYRLQQPRVRLLVLSVIPSSCVSIPSITTYNNHLLFFEPFANSKRSIYVKHGDVHWCSTSRSWFGPTRVPDLLQVAGWTSDSAPPCCTQGFLQSQWAVGSRTEPTAPQAALKMGRFPESIWTCLAIQFGSVWEYVHGIHMDTYGYLWIPMHTYGYLWIPDIWLMSFN